MPPISLAPPDEGCLGQDSIAELEGQGKGQAAVRVSTFSVACGARGCEDTAYGQFLSRCSCACGLRLKKDAHLLVM